MGRKNRKKDGDKGKDRKLTAGEWDIMRAVWEHEPCAAPTVTEALQKSRKWAYSTVKTMMDRMADKGLLTTSRMRNLILYRSAVTAAQAQASEVMGAVKRAFNGALTPMMQFLIDSDNLSAEQLGKLETLIKAKRRRGGGETAHGRRGKTS